MLLVGRCDVILPLPNPLKHIMMLQGVDRPNTTPIGQDRKFRDLRVLL